MSELLLVNPRRRKRRKKTTTRRRKTRARKKPVRRRRRNPAAPGTRRKRTYRRKRNPSGGKVFTQRNIMDVSTAAAKGAAGAIALDVSLAYLPLPAMLKSGITGKITKAAGAIALGAVARMTKFVSEATARDMTVGALTVQFTGIGRDLLGQFAPGIALSAYLNNDDYALGYAGSGWNPDNSLTWGNGMNAYMDSSGDIAAPGSMQPGLEAYSGNAFDW